MFIFSGELMLFTIELETVCDVDYLGNFLCERRTVGIYADEEDALCEFNELTFNDFYSEQEEGLILQSHLTIRAWTLSDHGVAEDFDTREFRNLLEEFHEGRKLNE